QTAKFAVGGFSESLSNEVKPYGIKVTVVEPSGVRTDWLAASLNAGQASENYDQTVGAMYRFLATYADSQPGDPVRIAKIIIDVADTDDPPLRLLLGSDAIAIAEEASKARAAEDEKWADVSRSADFPDGAQEMRATYGRIGRVSNLRAPIAEP
ncbi:short chain dehydrogenase, partial [Streptosporangium subroseum]